MEIRKRYSADFSQNKRKKLNLNEFTPVFGKTTADEVIKEFVFQKDVAPWFRGTSHYHIKGANRLLNALRDDGEQETTHRVQTCLNLIGLKPMITSRQIKILINLSRGSDLVFLWFLMENHYKTPKNKPLYFSQNEQLICSAICHLDMITTLRELDKVLPSGKTSKEKMKKADLKRQDPKDVLTKRKYKITKQQFELPYFIKCNRPHHYGKSLFLEQPNFKVNFKYYSHFNNRNYTVPNEINRWFVDYEFNSGGRVVNSIIREVMKNIFYNFETVCSKIKSADILCDHHKTLKVIETNLKHELKVKARDKKFKYCSTYKEENDKDNAIKIKKFINFDVQQQLCILSEQTKSLQKNDKLKTIASDCNVYDVILNGNEFSSGDCKINTNTKCESIRKKTKIIHNNHKETQHVETKVSPDKSIQIKKEKHNLIRPCNTNFVPDEEKLYENYTNKSTLLTPCDAFFKRPIENQPYAFDYKQIFSNFGLNEETGVQTTILKALGENISNFSTQNKNTRLLYDDAVKTYTRKTFDNEVKKFETAMTEEMKANPLSKYPTLGNDNDENFHLLEKMLFEAFQYLRKNPKFVWAQLPDAHRVPFLREWIAHRYGKEYTPKERVNSYRRSCLVFRALEKSNLKVSLPNANNIGKNFFVDYNCRKHVERKVLQIKSEYYHSLDSNFFHHSRVFWFAMRGYICSNGPPRKSFYAYMPSRLQDIQHFRLWKSSEYRNNWNAFNSRRHKR